MKCLSCSVEIDPKWKFAIEKNVCPFCGQSIMDEMLKELFTDLRNIMDTLQNHPEALEDWMFSNFSFLKTTSPKLIDFVDPELLKKTKKAENLPEPTTIKVYGQDVETKKTMTDDKANGFFERAGIVKKNDATPVSEQTQRMRNLMSQIQNGQIVSPDPNAEDVDPEAAKEYREAMEDQNPDADYYPSGGSISSEIGFGEESDIPLDVQLMMEKQAKGGVGHSQEYINHLRTIRERQERAKDNFESGANRGGKSGGFSRAG